MAPGRGPPPRPADTAPSPNDSDDSSDTIVGLSPPVSPSSSPPVTSPPPTSNSPNAWVRRAEAAEAERQLQHALSHGDLTAVDDRSAPGDGSWQRVGPRGRPLPEPEVPGLEPGFIPADRTRAHDPSPSTPPPPTAAKRSRQPQTDDDSDDDHLDRSDAPRTKRSRSGRAQRRRASKRAAKDDDCDSSADETRTPSKRKRGAPVSRALLPQYPAGRSGRPTSPQPTPSDLDIYSDTPCSESLDLSDGPEANLTTPTPSGDEPESDQEPETDHNAIPESADWACPHGCAKSSGEQKRFKTLASLSEHGRACHKDKGWPKAFLNQHSLSADRRLTLSKVWHCECSEDCPTTIRPSDTTLPCPGCHAMCTTRTKLVKHLEVCSRATADSVTDSYLAAAGLVQCSRCAKVLRGFQGHPRDCLERKQEQLLRADGPGPAPVRPPRRRKPRGPPKEVTTDTVDRILLEAQEFVQSDLDAGGTGRILAGWLRAIQVDTKTLPTDGIRDRYYALLKPLLAGSSADNDDAVACYFAAALLTAGVHSRRFRRGTYFTDEETEEPVFSSDVFYKTQPHLIHRFLDEFQEGNLLRAIVQVQYSFDLRKTTIGADGRAADAAVADGRVSHAYRRLFQGDVVRRFRKDDDDFKEINEKLDELYPVLPPEHDVAEERWDQLLADAQDLMKAEGRTHLFSHDELIDALRGANQTSSPGADKIATSHLVRWLNSDIVGTEAYKLVHTIAMNNIHDSARPFIRLLEGMLLRKQPTGIRPIGMGNCTVRIAARGVLHVLDGPLARALEPFQQSMARLGVPLSAFTVQQAFDDGNLVIKGDSTAAFQHVVIKAALDEIERHQELLPLAFIVAMQYRFSSFVAYHPDGGEVFLGGEDDDDLVKARTRGVNQGCALGTALYCLATATPCRNTIAAFPSVGVVAVADDTAVYGPTDDALDAQEYLAEQLKTISGVSQNPSKITAITNRANAKSLPPDRAKVCDSSSNREAAIKAGLVPVSTDGAIFFGAPVGTPAFASTGSLERVEAYCDAPKLLAGVGSATRHAVLTKCLNNKLSFSMQVTPPQPMAKAAKEHDTILRRVLSQSLYGTRDTLGPKDRPWLLSLLPIRKSGLGIISVEREGRYRHVAALVSVRQLAQRVGPDGTPAHPGLLDHIVSDQPPACGKKTITYLQWAAVQAFFKEVKDANIKKEHKQYYPAKAEQIDEVAGPHQQNFLKLGRSKFLRSVVSHDRLRERARRSECQVRTTANVLHTLPTCKPLRVTSTAMDDYLRMRLGVAMSTFDQSGRLPCGCQQRDDVETHLLCCPLKGLVIARHDGLAVAIRNLARKAGLTSPATEPRHPATGRRGADVLILGAGPKGEDIYIDVTVVGALINKRLRATAKVGGSAAVEAEEDKDRTWKDRVEGSDNLPGIPNAMFLGAAFTAHGSFSPAVSHLITLLGAAYEANIGTFVPINYTCTDFRTYCAQVLSAALANYNSKCLSRGHGGFW